MRSKQIYFSSNIRHMNTLYGYRTDINIELKCNMFRLGIIYNKQCIHHPRFISALRYALSVSFISILLWFTCMLYGFFSIIIYLCYIPILLWFTSVISRFYYDLSVLYLHSTDLPWCYIPILLWFTCVMSRLYYDLHVISRFYNYLPVLYPDWTLIYKCACLYLYCIMIYYCVITPFYYDL